jgi:transcriptional regulator with XRE-family HTH domain
MKMGTSYSNQDKLLLKKVGNQIKGLRIKTGLSQEKLAFACELDRTYIGSVERGERNISVLNLSKIAKALDVPLSDLLNF